MGTSSDSSKTRRPSYKLHHEEGQSTRTGIEGRDREEGRRGETAQKTAQE